MEEPVRIKGRQPSRATSLHKSMKITSSQHDQFFQEYTAPDAILKYTRATAGSGVSYLLDHDYKNVYLEALSLIPTELREQGIRIIEFGCGGGMNLVHLVSVLRREGIPVETALGVDFSPVLIEAAKREAKSYLPEEEARKVQFHIASNETLLDDLSASLEVERSALQNSFHFIFGVNTIRYCHAAKKELNCAQGIFDLLLSGGICVAIDMNNRFPLFRSDLRNRLRWNKEQECYVPTLEEYTAPFAQTGFEIVKTEHFCWVPHSAGGLLRRVMTGLSPLLNVAARSLAMRSLVIARKPN
jgi:hypothetical protein